MISAKNGKVFLNLYVQPGGKRSEVLGLYDGPDGQCLKIRVNAPPVDGKANEEILRFIAEILRLPARSSVLAKGSQSRKKTIEIKSVTEDDVRERVSWALSKAIS